MNRAQRAVVSAPTAEDKQRFKAALKALRTEREVSGRWELGTADVFTTVCLCVSQDLKTCKAVRKPAAPRVSVCLLCSCVSLHLTRLRLCGMLLWVIVDIAGC